MQTSLPVFALEELCIATGSTVQIEATYQYQYDSTWVSESVDRSEYTWEYWVYSIIEWMYTGYLWM